MYEAKPKHQKTNSMKTNLKIGLFIWTFILMIMPAVLSGQTVRIDFYPGSHGDIDIAVKRAVESMGYDTFINYKGRSDSYDYDILLRYRHHEGFMIFNLFGKEGQYSARSAERRVVQGNYRRAIERSLSELFDKEAVITHDRSEWLNLYPAVEKIDSAAYIFYFTAGSAADWALLENKFLTRAGKLLPDFETYYYRTKSQFVSSHGIYDTSSFITKLGGVVIGTEGGGMVRLEKPPVVYVDYLEERTPPLDVPLLENSGSFSTLFLMRNTGFAGSALRYRVFVNDKLVCALEDKKYVRLLMEPGVNTIAVQRTGSRQKRRAAEIEVDTEKGETIFVQIFQNSGLIVQTTLFNINEYDARKNIQDLRLQGSCF